MLLPRARSLSVLPRCKNGPAIRDEDGRIGAGFQGEVRKKRRRAIGASSSSRNTSAHHSP